MKHTFLSGAFAALALLAAPLAAADDAEPQAPAEPVAEAASAPAGKVGAALAAHGAYLSAARPNTAARYYAYVCSASWCAPCRQGMPHLVELYKEMKAGGIMEIVFVGYDGTEVEAKVFLSRYGAEFPATMRDDAEGLPGYERQYGIPAALIVDAEGNKVLHDHASVLMKWKQILRSYEQQKGLQPSLPAEGQGSADAPAEK